MTMLTPASSDLQEPLKFSELRMESVQAHFKNLKYHQMWADHLRAPACAILRLPAQNVRADGGGRRTTSRQIFAGAC